MDKDLKKEKIEKLEKKLENRQFTLYEVLQEEIAVDWFKMGHPAFLAMLHSQSLTEMIYYIIKVGPADNKIRSYKIPMIAVDIMSMPMPKVFELFFMDDEENKGEIVLARLLEYFDLPPNYVISSYVVKILINLLAGNAPRVLDYLFKNGKIMNLPNYLESSSIADFILRVIIVEDALLNHKIKERIELFKKIVDIYQQNKESYEILQNANYVLCEGMTRLWSQKHKELGRFSSEIFRIIELVIDNNNLVQQQNLIIVIMKHLALYADEAPCLIVVLFKKIHRELFLSNKPAETIKTQFKEQIPRFSMKNLKLLQAIHSMLNSIPQIMIKQITTNNIYGQLMDFVSKYEWNSIVLVQIQKIMKLSLAVGQKGKEGKEGEQKNMQQTQAIYNALFLQGNLGNKLRQLMKKQAERNKSSCGFSGFVLNLCTHLKTLSKNETGMGALIKKNQSDLMQIIEGYLRSRNSQISNDGFEVVHDVAKPHYHLNKIAEEFKFFFDETEAINKKYQIERPARHKEIKEDVLHEIQNENQLVYKLMTENSVEEKKAEGVTQNVQ